jgi:anti-sigma factor ChrR (cupin superfamily)
MRADEIGAKNSCDDAEASLAEQALGILLGDERAQVMTHLEACERCRVEAERLTATADSLLHLAPEIEPPLGLEVRLFQRQGVRA